MKAILCVLLVGTLVAPCLAEKIRDSDWQTGKLVDVRFEKDSRIVGVANQHSGVITQRRNDSTYYEIDAGEIVYVVKQSLTHRHDKQLKLTVNAPVKFAIVKDDFYLLDEDGKQQKLSIEKKTLKTNPETSNGPK
jgi:pyruvate dehydrogenase complex dehydrogenase (E1) component